MSDKTAIEWCDATFNPWWGCAKVSPGCDHCYAEAWAKRTGTAPWGVDTPRREFGDKHWNEPLKWARALPAKLGRRPRVFCASMADVFDKNAPPGALDRLWELIRDTPELDWLLLTKRIGNAERALPLDWHRGYSNVWLGITVVNQEEADRDIPKLLGARACVRFLSCEPLLGPIDLTRILLDGALMTGNAEIDRINFTVDALKGAKSLNWPGIDWVISGGESGGKARPSHPDWHRQIRDQSATAGVPYLFKQWGEWRNDMDFVREKELWDETRIRCSDYTQIEGQGGAFVKVGKKAAGRMLDGRTHDEYPA